MAAEKANRLDGLVRALGRLLPAGALVATLAYGIGSAPVATATLAVASLFLLVQHQQFRHALRTAHRWRTRETVLMAMNEPAYAQCWGPRFAPEHVDERLFFYANFVVLLWSHAWEDKLINEPKLRDLLTTFFDSEIPRMYWERQGDWHRPRRRWRRRRRFLDIVNEEYLRAIKAGPPARPYERMAAPIAKPRDSGHSGATGPTAGLGRPGRIDHV